jgi:hypothetical protein
MFVNVYTRSVIRKSCHSDIKHHMTLNTILGLVSLQGRSATGGARISNGTGASNSPPTLTSAGHQ